MKQRKMNKLINTLYRRISMRYRNHILFVCTILLTLVFLSSLNASAASEKQRMLDRIPAINTLKDKGLIGENNKGYLEYRSGSKPQQQLVSAENKDRKTVYGAIAKSQKVDLGLVGQRRAQQISAKGAKGHWFQKPDGSWYKK